MWLVVMRTDEKQLALRQEQHHEIREVRMSSRSHYALC